MVNALRGLRCCDGSMNWERRHGVGRGCLEKAGLWGGDILGEETSLSAAYALSGSCSPLHAVIRKMSILQNRNRVTDVENKLMVTRG